MCIADHRIALLGVQSGSDTALLRLDTWKNFVFVGKKCATRLFCQNTCKNLHFYYINVMNDEVAHLLGCHVR